MLTCIFIYVCICIQADTVAYNVVLEACARAGQVEEAVSLLRRMEEKVGR